MRDAVRASSIQCQSLTPAMSIQRQTEPSSDRTGSWTQSTTGVYLTVAAADSLAAATTELDRSMWLASEVLGWSLLP